MKIFLSFIGLISWLYYMSIAWMIWPMNIYEWGTIQYQTVNFFTSLGCVLVLFFLIITFVICTVKFFMKME